jgi:hypothetical protein
MNFDWLDNALWKPIGKGLSEADTFIKREMPFDSGWGAPAAVLAAIAAPEIIPYFTEAAPEASGGGGILGSIGGSGGTFSGDLFQLGGSSGVGDVFGGWSPTGSSASGLYSDLGVSSSNPFSYSDPYAAQDVMQQARDTNVLSGSPSSWDTSSFNFDFDYAKKLAEQLLKNRNKSNTSPTQQKRSGYVDYSLMQPTPVISGNEDARHRALLAEQLRLMQSIQAKKQAAKSPLDLASLFEKYGTLS